MVITPKLTCNRWIYSRLDKTAGTFITFSQFLFISLLELPLQLCYSEKWKIPALKKTIAPLSAYGVMVILFFSSSILTNFVFRFHISMALNSVFRSGTMVANVLVSYLVFGRRTSGARLTSILIATAGIILCTIYSVGPPPQKNGSLEERSGEEWMQWAFGVPLLTASLILASFLGIQQQSLNEEYNSSEKLVSETKFYTHLLSLPFFCLFATDLIHSFSVLIIPPSDRSDLFFMIGSSISLPKGLLFSLINVISQYGCISSVYHFLSLTDSLSLQMALTVRKMLSLVVSVFYFHNPFPLQSWMGAALVFSGALFFSFLSSPTIPSAHKRKGKGDKEEEHVEGKEEGEQVEKWGGGKRRRRGKRE